MKKIYLTTMLTFAAGAFAQCPTGSVTFTNQAQINNFVTQYPNCTEINGDISIEGSISNLNGLANIVTIAGALEIREVSNLENLDGLESLESVGTDLILREVDDLQNIEALSSLTSVGGEFTIRTCPELVNLNGVENLTSVGLGLIVRDCESLISIEGLSGISTVGEILEIVENPVLESLTGLENILTIGGGEEGALVIEGNDLLTSLEGFGSALTVMTGGITIASNGDLSYCSVPAICTYLQNPPQEAIITIGLNVTGCNADTEVLAICAPLEVPTITAFTPNTGCAGTEVVITGTGFSSITSVTIGGTQVQSYVVNNTVQITAIVGPGTTGIVEVINMGGTAESVETFTVTPSPGAPIGNAVQVFNVDLAGDATIANLEAAADEGGMVIWYASEEDALAGENALTANIPLENGTVYFATQTIGDCTSVELLEVSVEVLLGAETFTENGFTLYPNPINDVAYFSVADPASIESITLADMNGRVIRKWNGKDNTVLDMNGITKGLYILMIQNGDVLSSVKISKQ